MASAGKTRISAEYVGWKALKSIADTTSETLDEVVTELLDKRRLKGLKLKRQGIEFCRSRLRVFEATLDAEGNAVKYKYPSIPLKDIAAARQELSSPDNANVLTLVLLGFNEESQNSVHAHVWRGKSPQEVASFAHKLQHALADAAEGGTRRAAAAGSQLHQGRHQSHQEHQHQPVADSAAANLMAAELRERLSDKSGAPLLDPPRDYDTLHRSHGNVMLRWTEQQLCTSSKAPTGAYIRRSQLDDEQEKQLHLPMQIEAEPQEPLPDYQLSDSDDADDLSLSGSSFSGSQVTSASQQQVADASFNSSDRSYNSDHSADPARGFSTWRCQRNPHQLSVHNANRQSRNPHDPNPFHYARNNPNANANANANPRINGAQRRW